MTHKFASMDALQHTVAITIPTTQGVSGEAKERKVRITRNIIKESLAKMFGGFTETQANGGYVSDAGELVEETVFVIKANAAKLHDFHYNCIHELAELVKERHEQECVAVEIDGKMYFV